MQMSDVRVHVGPEPDDLIEQAVARGGGTCVSLEEAEALVWMESDPSRFPDPLPADIRWVQLSPAGIERWLDDGVVTDEAVFTSARGAYSHTVAEHALALVLAGARDLPHWVQQREWAPHQVQELRDATVTVVGSGGIGQALIGMLAPLEAHVVAVTRSGRAVPGATESAAAEQLPELWGRSDYVVVAAPATAGTRHLVDRDVLAAMPAHGWLVNVARGSLVDHDALADALRDGVIRGAALDVTEPEPLPAEHPLWAEPSAVITPHVANPKPVRRARLAERVEENVRRFARDEPLLGTVEPRLGY